MGNPFTPGFGEHPPVWAGRRAILKRWADALDPDVDTHPARRTYLKANRGVGKTVLLDAAHDIAVERGWIVVEENGAMTRPLLDRLVERLSQPETVTPSSTSVSLDVGPVTVSRDWTPMPMSRPASLRDAIPAVMNRPDPPAGVLITVDEIHDAPASDIKNVANEFQHLVRDGYRVALFAAGLPDPNEHDPARFPTFLSRAWTPAIATVADPEIAEALTLTLSETGRRFSPDGLAAAVDLAGGLPYAMQLVGWYAVDRADEAVLRAEDVQSVKDVVHDNLISALQIPFALSPARLAFLDAMALDSAPSRISDVAQRLHRTPQQLSPTRAWLIRHGYVVATGHGELAFVHPGTRALLRTRPSSSQ